MSGSIRLMTSAKVATRRGRGLAVALAVLPSCCALLPRSAAAQSSRADVLAAESRDKAAHLGPEAPSTMESFMVWAQRSPLLGGLRGPYPWLGTLYSGAGLGIGAGYMRRMAGNARLNVLGAVSTEGSTLLATQIRSPDFAHGLLAVKLDARRTFADDQPFFGIGANSALANPLVYDLRPAELGVTALFQPGRWMAIAAKYEYLDMQVEGQTPRTPSGPLGFGRELSYDVLQASAALDWRTAPGYSTRGGLQRLTWSQYLEARDRPFSFQELEYEGIQLVPLLREQFVLALRGLATVTMTQGDDAMPVILDPTLGGAETLRGFDTRRFTDRNRILLNCEYRWRPSRYVDMAAFFDAGRVVAQRSDLGLSHLETDWGLGSRFHTDTAMALRAEIAKSREGWQIVLAEGKLF